MVDKPLTEHELRTKINEINIRIRTLALQNQKYLADLKYYTDPEYRERETIYKEKCLTAATSQAN